MKLLKNFILAPILLSTPILAFAGGNIKADKIESVSFQQAGFFLSADGWGNPNNCTRSNAVVLQASDPNYDKAYALLLAAYMSGKTVTGYSDKCVEHDGQTFNMIRGFKYLSVSK